MDERTYEVVLDHQRSLGLAQVGMLLDRLCLDLGLDPVNTWRLPRMHEAASLLGVVAP